MKYEWWRKAVVYQIYPKSFYDTEGTGVGDLKGVTKKLDYLKTLGVDVIWLTPIYESPQNDNGYDISDYYKIYEPYGTMEDFEDLLFQAHEKGLKIVMDIVVNHTSTAHKWFREARKGPSNPYRDFYIWKEGKEGGPPTNWKSKFGGSAWEYDEDSNQYYLHLYDVTQADLNWENEKVRQEVYKMMNFWFQKGVDGFRLDVINVISKDQRFLDDDNGDGRKYYTDGPRVHEYMNEMNRTVFSKYNVMTVGEMSSTAPEECVKYTNPERQELNMTFNFHHLKVDYKDGEKWSNAPFDFLQLKEILSHWQEYMDKGDGWNALFWCNHDQPRVVSRYGNDQEYHKESAKMLATVVHMMKGTPYIYQGEEIGMTNPYFSDIKQYRDVESLNMFKEKKEEGCSEEEILAILKQKSRDNSRTPMQWNGDEHGGFTTGTPWISLAPNYEHINVKEALEDEESIFYHYRKLIELRKTYNIITEGDYKLLLRKDERIFAYTRNTEEEQLVVLNNFYSEEQSFSLPESVIENGELLLGNYNDAPSLQRTITLRPYESVIYLSKK
ncbi:alpha,alpha-phosphotrehalase [Bacillus sp. JZ8]